MSKKPSPKINESNLWTLMIMLQQAIIYGHFLNKEIVEPPSTKEKPEGFSFVIEMDDQKFHFDLQMRHYERLLLENYVLSIYRIINWIGSMVSTNQIPKPSPLRDFRNHWEKPVTELRDFLMHLDQYDVRGGGQKRDKLNEGFMGSHPTATIVMKDSFVSGQFIKDVYLIGGRVDFKAISRDLNACYCFCEQQDVFKSVL